MATDELQAEAVFTTSFVTLSSTQEPSPTEASIERRRDAANADDKAILNGFYSDAFGLQGLPHNLAESEGSTNIHKRAPEAPEEEESESAAPTVPLVLFIEEDFYYAE